MGTEEGTYNIVNGITTAGEEHISIGISKVHVAAWGQKKVRTWYNIVGGKKNRECGIN